MSEDIYWWLFVADHSQVFQGSGPNSHPNCSDGERHINLIFRSTGLGLWLCFLSGVSRRICGIVTHINWRCHYQHSVRRKDRTNYPTRSSKIDVYVVYINTSMYIYIHTEKCSILYSRIVLYHLISTSNQSIFPSPNSSIQLDAQGMASSPYGKQHNLPAAGSGCGSLIMMWNRPTADSLLQR